MNRLTVLLTAILAVGLLTGPLFAAETETMDRSLEMATSSSIFTEEQLLGLTVVNPAGDEIGEIKEVSMDSETGRINFVILARGGFFGIGAERHAVPLAALKIRSGEETATLLVSEDKLTTAPTKTAEMSDRDFRGLIHEHYGLAPAWEEHREGATGEMMEEKTDEYRGENYR